jgi:P-type Mg2+ transporter
MNGSSLLDRLNFKRLATNRRPEERDADFKLSREILELSRADKEAIWKMLRSTPDGLDPVEAKVRLASVGPNLIAKEGRSNVVKELWGRAKNPLNALLLSLAAVSYFLSDILAAVVIVIMVVLAITTAFAQEHRSNGCKTSRDGENHG